MINKKVTISRKKRREKNAIVAWLGKAIIVKEKKEIAKNIIEEWEKETKSLWHRRYGHNSRYRSIRKRKERSEERNTRIIIWKTVYLKE